MKICPSCGATMEDTAAFCTKCGTKFENNSAGNTSSNETAPNTNPFAGSGASAAGASNTGAAGAPNSGTAGAYTNSGYTAPPYGGAPNYQNGPVYMTDPYDHTAEFTQKDISDNKVVAMLVYLLGTMGIIIALLGSQSSPYAAFHVRQALKFTVLHVLMGLITVFLFWTIIIPLAAAIFYLVLFVVKIICFFSICKGQAKEPPIIRSFGFLR